MNLKTIFSLFKQAFEQWRDDKASRWAAALSYYTIFSLAPVLVIGIAIAGLVYGQRAVRGEIVGEIQELVGERVATIVQSMLVGVSHRRSGIIATAIGVVTLIFAATGIFNALKDALNVIWGVRREDGQGLVGVIRDRFLALTMVLGIGFLLMAALTAQATVTAVAQFLPNPPRIAQFGSLGILFAMITLLFAIIYKTLPDVDIKWKDVWIGAAVTSLLFSLGQVLIGQYLVRSSYQSTYGAAGSLIVILAWVYYSAQIFFYGAEFTQVYANTFGSRIKPADDAVFASNKAAIVQGSAGEHD